MPLAVAGRQGVKADRPAAQERESTVWPLICFHLEAGQTKTRAPEPPAGRFPKFLLPRAAGRPQKLKFILSGSSPTLVRVVGGEWNSGIPAGSSNFPGLHMADWYAPGSANWRQGRRNNYFFCYQLQDDVDLCTHKWMGRWRNWLTCLGCHQSLASVDWGHPVS